jgi:RPA family protein
MGKPYAYERRNRMNTPIHLESITEVDETTRDTWVRETAVQTRKRLAAFEAGTTPLVSRVRRRTVRT